MAKPGLDGHDRGVRVMSRAFRNAGIEVVYTGLRQSVDQIVSAAIQEDVDFIGLSILSGAHIGIAKKLMKKLCEKGATDKAVLIGGVIPQEDVEELKSLGVAGVFGVDTPMEEAIDFVIKSSANTGRSGIC
jgi:methylmalonyl-CoA mutase C-terminal domain/subunit